jgi:hypothetical protein
MTIQDKYQFPQKERKELTDEIEKEKQKLRADILKKCLPDYKDIPIEIKKVCDEVAAMLIEKNKAYGNSALNPVRIFSKADAIEQLNVRIDDKLSRVERGHDYAQEDTEMDLIGYLILKQVAKRK